MSFDTIEANWRTYLMFPLYQTFGPRHKSENNGGEPGKLIHRFYDTKKKKKKILSFTICQVYSCYLSIPPN